MICIWLSASSASPALVELCRRCVGLPILCVAGVLLVYTFFNLMGTPSADQVKLTHLPVIRTMFYTNNGIFGGPISVCAKFIVVFIIFGAFLERTGIAQFFINLANAVVGAAPWRSRQGGCHLLRPVRHGVRLLRGQHCYHRFRHHPHDEENRLQGANLPALWRRLHPPAADHAPHHGCRCLFDGGVHW